MFRRFAFSLFLLVTALTSLHAQLRVASPFGDHMVLQRDKPVPVWGWADPGAKVTIAFDRQKKSTTAAEDGSWQVNLSPLKTSATPRTFTITAQNRESKIETQIAFTDVLVGEVWLCSGQSNMERQLGPRPGQNPLIGWESEVATANRPLLRQLYVTQTISSKPQSTVEASWSVCSPATVIDFTAVGYYFARDLQAALGDGVPVGIIHSSWGGTPAQPWMSAEGLVAFPEEIARVEEMRAYNEDPEKAHRQFLWDLTLWCEANDIGTTAKPAWFEAGLDDSQWPVMNLPTFWEDAGLGGFDGVVWFRLHFDLPPELHEQDLVLHLGTVDDIDTTWMNGSWRGSNSGWNTTREYTIEAPHLRKTNNVLTVRVVDTGGGGGIWSDGDPISIKRVDGQGPTVNLNGPARYRVTANLNNSTPPPVDLRSSPASPTMLFNGMIAPLVPYALRGVAFYQGESNAGNAMLYRSLLPALIQDWRQQWSTPDLPFLFVQIAPFQQMGPEIREAQLIALKATTNTAMVVTTDAGDATDIHPSNKEPVGARLALAARALAYGEAIDYSGPVYTSADIASDHITLHFTHIGGGLIAPGGTLQGFTIAGADNVFHPATATIEGDTVKVSSFSVPAPLAVRYAWANVAWGNLYNTAGLPASPFRTDIP